MVVIDYEDIGKDKLELLLDLLYESTGTRFPLSKIKFGVPRVMDTTPDNKYDANTFVGVEVSADYSTEFGKDAGIAYRRFDIVDYLATLPSQVLTFHTTELPVKLCDILPQINTYLEFPLDCEDVLDYEITQEGEQTIVITMDPKSYIWFGFIKIRVNIIKDGLVPLYSTVMMRGFDIYGSGPFQGLPAAA